MSARLLLVAVVLLAFAGQATAAGGTEVSVRVEGLTETRFDGNVETKVHPVNGGDGSGPHRCGGPFGAPAAASLTGALDDAMRTAGLSWGGNWDPSAGDFLIEAVAGEEATPATPWSTLLNGVPTPTGGCTTTVRAGDRILLAYDAVFKSKSLSLAGPAATATGAEFSLLVTDDRAGGQPVGGATVAGPDGRIAVTDTAGHARFRLNEPGRYDFKAEHPGGVRSNRMTVCAGTGLVGCESGPVPAGHATRIDKIGQGQRFLRGAGPRVLRGKVNGAARVRIELRRIGRKHGKEIFRVVLKAAADNSWMKAIGPLRPGRYRLSSRALGLATPQPWVKGMNRIDFTIGHRRLGRYRLAGRATTYLRRAARSRTVRRSGLLRGWVTIALGRHRTGARSLVGNQLGRQLDDGSFGGDLNRTAMAILALKGRRPAAVDRAAAWLASRQGEDGGFGFGSGPLADVDTTGVAAWALALAGRPLPAREAAAFIRGLQNDDGGLPAVAGGSSNAQSTGLGLLGIRATGFRPRRVKTEDGLTPLHFLATLQRRNGAIDYSPGLATTPSWVTAQARLGLTPRAGLLP